MSPAAVPYKPRVFSLYNLDEETRAFAEQHFDFTCYPDAGWKNWREDAEGIILRSETISVEDVERCGPQLKFVGKHGVGVDRLAIKELKEKGITVMNTPGVNVGLFLFLSRGKLKRKASAVAELALTLALCIARNVAHVDRRVRSGETVTKADAGAVGFQLTGKTLGLVGGGNIGYQLGKMFNGAFGSKVVIYDPHLSPNMAQQWADLLPSSKLQRVNTLDEMLSVSDVVSIHVPLLESTKGLISTNELRKMKSSAILINTARGGIVDEDALATALDEGWIVGAGIDAFATEPPTLEQYSRLINHSRVISTRPHIGAASLDVIRMTAVSALEHLIDAFKGNIRDVVEP